MEPWQVREVAWKYGEKIRRLDERIRILNLEILEDRQKPSTAKREEVLAVKTEKVQSLTEQARKMSINAATMESLAQEADRRTGRIEEARRDLEKARYHQKEQPKEFIRVEGIYKYLLDEKRALRKQITALTVMSAVR